MPLLFEEDYLKLKDRGLSYHEREQQRFFLFTDLRLPAGMYATPTCDVLVEIPPNYNQAGNDMFWTHPRLYRADGKVIPQVLDLGGGDNRICDGREFSRWSRHWNPSGKGAWRPGKDDIVSIYRRVEWALSHPDCK